MGLYLSHVTCSIRLTTRLDSDLFQQATSTIFVLLARLRLIPVTFLRPADLLHCALLTPTPTPIMYFSPPFPGGNSCQSTWPPHVDTSCSATASSAMPSAETSGSVFCRARRCYTLHGRSASRRWWLPRPRIATRLLATCPLWLRTTGTSCADRCPVCPCYALTFRAHGMSGVDVEALTPAAHLRAPSLACRVQSPRNPYTLEAVHGLQLT